MDGRALLYSAFVASFGLFLLTQTLPIQLGIENEIGEKLQNQSTGEEFSTTLLHLAGAFLSSPFGTVTTIVGAVIAVFEITDPSSQV